MLKSFLTFIQYRTSWLTILSLFAATALMMFLMNGTELPFSSPTIDGAFRWNTNPGYAGILYPGGCV